MKDTGWLRCINKVDADRQKYFEHMSEAYALSCSGDVLVMADDPKNVPTTGIWGTVEFPTLKKMDTIGDINAIDIEGGNSNKIWPEEEGLTSEDTLEIFQIIGKRADCEVPNHPEPDGEDWFG